MAKVPNGVRYQMA